MGKMKVFHKKVKYQKGLSLLELLVSILLLCTVMMTFAMVFPGGYRLNLKNRMESRALKIANGIMNKMMKIPVSDASGTKPSILNMVNWHRGYFADYFEKDIPPEFFLPDGEVVNGNTLKGIKVTLMDGADVKSVTLVKIEVTVAWRETQRGNVVTKYVTLTGYRSLNHQ